MKTIEQLNQEKLNAIADGEKLGDYEFRSNLDADEKKEKKLKNKYRKRVAFIKSCILYLESNPRESFVVEMRDECTKRLDILNRNLASWKASMPQHLMEKIANPDKYYYDNIGKDEKKEIKNVTNQLKMINHLLSN